VNTELKTLLERVKAAKLDSPERVQVFIDSYMGETIWSLLKTEWETLSTTEKRALAIKLFKQSRK
jgi:hypothetical protein